MRGKVGSDPIEITITDDVGGIIFVFRIPQSRVGALYVSDRYYLSGGEG